LVNSCTCWCWN